MPIVNTEILNKSSLEALGENSNFILPSKNTIQLKTQLIEQFLGRIPVSSETDFLKDVLSCCMGELGVESGVGFSNGIFPDATFKGSYINGANVIDLNEESLKDDLLAHKIVVASHEVFHKYQAEVSKKAKFFGPRQGEYVTSGTSMIGNLLKIKNDYRPFYFHSKSEQQAFEYGRTFTINFLEMAKQMPNLTPELMEFIEYQQQYVAKEQDYVKSKIAYIEQKFISNQLPIFYKNATESFDMFYTLSMDSAFAPKTAAAVERNKEAISRINSIYGKTEPHYHFASLMAQAGILSYCPERSRVEKFVDALIGSPQDESVLSGMFRIVRERIPVTRTDLCKLLMSIDSDFLCQKKDDYVSFIVNNIDEEFLSSTLIACYGKEKAEKIIAHNADKNFDKSKAELSFAKANFAPILKLGETDLYSVEDVFNAVLFNAGGSSGFASMEEFFNARVQLADNLAKIVSHFGFPTTPNYYFSESLVRFANNPFEKQYHGEKEKISEKGCVLSDRISEKLEQYIAQERRHLFSADVNKKDSGVELDEVEGYNKEQKLTVSSNLTLAENGLCGNGFDKELEKSVKNLAEAKEKLAEQIANIDSEKLARFINKERESNTKNSKKDEEKSEIIKKEDDVLEGNYSLEEHKTGEDSGKQNGDYMKSEIEGQNDDQQGVLTDANQENSPENIIFNPIKDGTNLLHDDQSSLQIAPPELEQ